MEQMQRRSFLAGLTGSMLARTISAYGSKVMPLLSLTMAARLEDMSQALAQLTSISALWRSQFNAYRCVQVKAGAGLSEKFIPTPVTQAYVTACDRACHAIEAVFMTSPETEADEDAIMAAFDHYAEVAQAAFHVQTARDLFTPLRYQSMPSTYRALQKGLLTDPDEAFAKSDVPWFLTAMRRAL